MKILICVIINLFLLFKQVFSIQAAPFSYNFSKFDSENWNLLDGCIHCDSKNLFSPHKGECTQNNASAVSFG